MPEAFNLLVTGSRSWDRPDVAYARLDAIVAEAVEAGASELVVIHGASYPRERNGVRPEKSADYLAHLWCERGGHPLPVRELPCPAAWTLCVPECKPGHRKHNHGRSWCPLAGFRRNSAMAQAGADLLLALWRNQSGGTKQMLGEAKAAGIPAQVVDYANCPPLQPLTEKTHV